MKFLKCAIAMCILLMPTLSNAYLIAPPVTNVYVLDEATRIVTDRSSGKEWLQWTETLGMSVNTALSTYESDGWRVANSLEMAILFSRFFKTVAWDTDEDTHQDNMVNFSDYGVEPQFYHDGVDPSYPFGELFGRIDFGQFEGGSVYVDNEKLEDLDGFYMTEAIYGTDDDGDGYLPWTRVWTEHTGVKPDGTLIKFADRAMMGRDNRFTANDTWATSGVALIRDTRPHKVPEPSPLALLAAATLGVFCLRRRSRSQPTSSEETRYA